MSSRRVKSGGPRKAPRAKPGTKTLREIKMLQKNYGKTDNVVLFPRKRFENIVRREASNTKQMLGYGHINYKFEKVYINALKECTELYLQRLCKAAGMIATHCNRQAITKADLVLAKSLIG